ncbi:TauD/TfdA family dioxygenase [Mesorhizobium sp. BHbsci]
MPPGYQFLHCIANEAEGGGSVFADGFAVVAALQAEDPEAYRLLCEVEIPYRFHDENYDLRGRFAVIVARRNGEVTELRFNAHLVDVIDLPSDICAPFYAAYRKLMMMIRSSRFQIAYRLEAGEMAVFDNRRVLHGRQSFNPNTGRRHLRGWVSSRRNAASVAEASIWQPRCRPHRQYGQRSFAAAIKPILISGNRVDVNVNPKLYAPATVIAKCARRRLRPDRSAILRQTQRDEENGHGRSGNCREDQLARGECRVRSFREIRHRQRRCHRHRRR